MAMVLRSQVRDGRSSVAIGNPAEIPVSVYTCQPGLGATGPTVVESITKQIGTHPVTPENNTHLSFHTSPGTTLDSHTRLTKCVEPMINLSTAQHLTNCAIFGQLCSALAIGLGLGITFGLGLVLELRL